MKTAISPEHQALKQPTDQLLREYHDLIVLYRLRKTKSTDPRAELPKTADLLLAYLEKQLPKELKNISRKQIDATLNSLHNVLLNYMLQEPKKIHAIIEILGTPKKTGKLEPLLNAYTSSTTDTKQKKTADRALKSLKTAQKTSKAFLKQEKKRLPQEFKTYSDLYLHLAEEIANTLNDTSKNPAQITTFLKEFLNQNTININIARKGIADCENQLHTFSNVIPPLLESLSQLVPVNENLYQRAIQTN